jgi:hypothetical protein
MAFSSGELKAILILGLISGFVVAFDDFTLIEGNRLIIEDVGLLILLLSMFGMVISVYIHETAHRFFARRIGYNTNIEGYYPGQVLGIVLAIFSFGWIQFFTPNTTDLEARPDERIHKHRKYENPKQQAFISMAGVIATVFVATIMHGAWLLATINGVVAPDSADFLRNIMMGNVWLMVYSLIPFELLGIYFLRFTPNIQQLPQSDGLYILNYSLVAYVTVAAFIIFMALMLALSTNIYVWAAIFIALSAGGYTWWKFFTES